MLILKLCSFSAMIMDLEAMKNNKINFYKAFTRIMAINSLLRLAENPFQEEPESGLDLSGRSFDDRLRQGVPRQGVQPWDPAGLEGVRILNVSSLGFEAVDSWKREG